jgi:uncharacterized protein YdcH (DUF465 family)
MRSLPQIYSQRDDRWKNQRLGTVDGTTIGAYGCYVTSDAMVASYYGRIVTPASLDDLFTTQGLYVNGNMLTDDQLHKAFSDIQYLQTFNYATTSADLGKLRDLLSDPTISVIIEVDFDHNPTDGIQTHFMVAVACDGSSIMIADPWQLPGSIDLFTKNYGNNPAQTILKFVVYKGTPVQQTQATEDIQKTLDSLRTARDNNWNLYQTEIETNKNLSNQIIQLNDKITELEGQVSTLNAKTTELQKETQQAKDDAANYLQQLSDEKKADSASINKGLDDQYKLKDELADKHLIATALNTADDTKAILDGVARLENQVRAKEIEKQSLLKGAEELFSLLINKFVGRKK